MIMPVSTRLWTAAVLAAAAFCAWAVLAPSPGAPAAEAGDGAMPAYPAIAPVHAAAPNPADPAWAQPLFFPGRQPRVAMIEGGSDGVSDGAGGLTATLTGVLRSPRLALATLGGVPGGKPVRVRLGQEIEGLPGWRLVSLAARSATFRNGDREQVLVIDARSAQAAASAATDAPATPPSSAAPAATPDPAADAPATAPDPATAAADTPEQRAQVEAIRKRIQERRARMNSPAPPSAAPRKSP